MLFAGFSVAFLEYWFDGPKDDTANVVAGMLLMGVFAVWVLWCVVFGFMSRSIDRFSVGGRMYKCLIAGSVLELLVAVPMHLIVRRRTDCCAGAMTGMGISIGILIMFLSLGPAVLLLFFLRYRQVYSKSRR